MSRTITALAEAMQAKDAAYLERNRCVALLVRMALVLGLRAGLARTAIEGWSAEWHGCVYIDLPTGQVSWHYHDSQTHLFAGLPAYEAPWDGHDTPEKYRRVAEAYPAGEHVVVPNDVLPFGEGDTLLMSTSALLSREQYDRLRSHIADQLNSLAPVIVFSGLPDLQLRVMRRRERQADQANPARRCKRCGRYEDGLRPCPNGDSACPQNAATEGSAA